MSACRWVDTHAHLYDAAYDSDRTAVLDRAAGAGVDRMILIAEDAGTARRIQAMAEGDPRLYWTAGIHPSETDVTAEADLAELETIVAAARSAPSAKLVAVGEIGLDYYWTRSNLPAQRALFRRQLELAHRYDLPVVIHDREAHADVLDCLLAARADGLLRAERPGVFHCYSGSPEFAARLIELGFYIGIDGPVTYKNARKTVETAAAVPLDRLLLETDSPYLTPVPHRGKRNEPAWIPLIGARVAAVRGLTPEALAAATTANAEALFDLR